MAERPDGTLPTVDGDGDPGQVVDEAAESEEEFVGV